MRAVEWDVRDAWVRDGGEGRGLDLGSGLGGASREYERKKE